MNANYIETYRLLRTLFKIFKSSVHVYIKVALVNTNAVHFD